MTTSRIVRGTKGRIFLYICAILIVTGIIACYNNTRIELDNVQKSNELCRQQQENLSTQLQVISDYKQRLEKSLKTEKAEHQQARAELESRINEEKLKNEKSTSDATLRFNSLQQHYTLLKTQHNDLKEECSKIQREQLDDINHLQAKTKEVQGQLKQAERDKENSLGHMKSQLEQLKVEKANLEKQIKGNADKEEIFRLQKELNDLKVSCKPHLKNFETLQAPVQSNISDIQADKTHFAKQIPLDGSEYRISGNKNDANVADIPSNVDDTNNIDANQLDAPKQDKLINSNSANEQNVLPVPNNIKSDLKSSTPNSNIRNSSNPSMNIVAPLRIPTVTPETLKLKTPETKQLNNPLPAPAPNRKFPDGVVPPHKQHFDFEAGPVEQNLKGDFITNFVNNRYRNIIDDDKEKNKDAKQKLNDVAEKENGANEIFDFPISDGENNNNAVGAADVGIHKVGEDQKHHIDSLAIGGEKDKLYDAGDYDKDAQNDANLEEDEDADDFGNNNQEPVVRN